MTTFKVWCVAAVAFAGGMAAMASILAGAPASAALIGLVLVIALALETGIWYFAK